MIAIASGLLGGLETASAAVVKKDVGSTGFAAAFEQVSVKDAEAQGGAKVRAAVVTQGRRVAGTGSRGQAGIVGGRGGSAAVLVGKAVVPKAAGNDVAAESALVELKVGADGNEAPSSAARVASAATKAASVTKLDAADFLEADAAVQGSLAESEVAAGGSSGDKQAVPGGVLGRASKGQEGAGSAIAGALPEGVGKVPAQASVGGAAPVIPANRTLQPVTAVAASEIKNAGQEAPGAPLAEVPDVLSASGNTLAKTIGAGASSPGVAAIGSGVLQSPVAPIQGEAGLEPIAKEDAAPAIPGAGAAVTVAGQTARTAKGLGTVVALKAQEGSAGPQTSTAKTDQQRALRASHGQPTDGPVNLVGVASPQEGAGAIGQQGVNVAPAVVAEIVGPQRTVTQQTAVAPDGLANTSGSAVLAPVASSSGKPLGIIQQAVDAEADLAQAPNEQAGIGQNPLVEQFFVQQTNVQQIGVQQPSAAPAGVVGLVAEETASVAHGFGAPTVGTEQAPSQPAGTQQVRGQQAASQQSGPQQAQAPLPGAPLNPGAQFAEKAEQPTSGQKPALIGSEPTVAGQQAGKSVDAGKDKNPPVAASSSNAGKKVQGSSLDRSAHAQPVSIVADGSVSTVPVGPPSVVVTAQSATLQAPLPGFSEPSNLAAGRVDGTRGTNVAVPSAGAAAPTLRATTAGDQGGAPVIPENSVAPVDSTGLAAQTTISAVQASSAPVPAAVIAEIPAPQTGRTVAGPTGAAKERRAGSVEGKTVERTSEEQAPVAPPIASQHPAFSGSDAPKPASGSHQTPSEAGTQSLTTGTPGFGGGIGAVPLTGVQTATHGVVAPQVTAPSGGSGTQSATQGGVNGSLTAQGVAATDSLIAPMAHTTLQATPTVLEVGIPGGTHGWLKIRAEIGEGGTVQASMSAATHEGQETLRRELPAMNAFLDSEHLPVSVQVASHGLSGSGSAAAGSLSGDTGFNLGAGLSQDAGSAQRDAGTGVPLGGDGARQGGGEGSQDANRASTPGTPVNAREAVRGESDWVPEAGAGYGSGVAANGGSWLNVMA